MASPIELLQQRTTETTEEPLVLDIHEGSADEVFDALSTETRRRIYRGLFAEPQTTSELADSLDTSIQNVQYHLETLKSAGLVEAADTIYSPKGNEMAVFAPANDPIVFVGSEEHATRLEASLPQILTGLGLIGIASLLVQWVGNQFITFSPESGGGLSPASPESSISHHGQPVRRLGEHAVVLEPGLVFFVGMLLVAAIAVRIQQHTE
jgi:DNA-binding transcriptional ArsR family regulator